MPDDPKPPEPEEEPEADAETGEEEAAPALDESDRKAAVESLILSSAHAVPVARITRAVGGGVAAKDVRAMVAELNRDYESSGRAFEIREIADGFRAFTRPKFHGVLKLLRRAEREERLTAAALETLAVIAYRQPILRADIDAIRGVQSDAILRGLLDKGLVRIAGRADVLGRPLLYGTTQKFLSFFGIAALSELPKPEEVPVAPAAPGAKPLPVGGVRIQEPGTPPTEPPAASDSPTETRLEPVESVPGSETETGPIPIPPPSDPSAPESAAALSDPPPAPKKKRGRPPKNPKPEPATESPESETPTPIAQSPEADPLEEPIPAPAPLTPDPDPPEEEEEDDEPDDSDDEETDEDDSDPDEDSEDDSDEDSDDEDRSDPDSDR